MSAHALPAGIFPISFVADMDGRHHVVPIMAREGFDGFHPLLAQVLVGRGHMNKEEAEEFAALIVQRVNGWEALAASHAELVTICAKMESKWPVWMGTPETKSALNELRSTLLRAREVNT